jgi:hypothetical protein
MKKQYWIALALLIIIILVILFRTKITDLFKKKTTTVPPSGNSGSGTGSGNNGISGPLDYNKMLKQGVTGNEVKLLQSWLGVTQDGDFGPITAQALLNRKGAIEITLAQFNAWPDWEPEFLSTYEEDGFDSGGQNLFINTNSTPIWVA